MSLADRNKGAEKKVCFQAETAGPKFTYKNLLN